MSPGLVEQCNKPLKRAPLDPSLETTFCGVDNPVLQDTDETLVNPKLWTLKPGSLLEIQKSSFFSKGFSKVGHRNLSINKFSRQFWWTLAYRKPIGTRVTNRRI
jgi:hypothetical protein